jgi:putative transcriptional regulator
MGFEKEENDEEFGTLAEALRENPEIVPGIYFGGPQVLVRIFAAGLSADNKYRLFTGMSGWAPGQLESEIENGAWEVRDAEPGLIFDLDKIASIAPLQKTKSQRKFGFDPSNN